MISVPAYTQRISSAKRISFAEQISPVPPGTDLIAKKQPFGCFFCWKGCAKKMPLNQRALHRFGGNCTAISITWESMIYNYYFDIRQLHYFSYLRKSVLALKVPGCAVLPKTSRLMCFVMVFLI